MSSSGQDRDADKRWLHFCKGFLGGFHRKDRASIGPLVVWTSLVAMSLGWTLLIRSYGVDCPLWDEWVWVPRALGEQPVTLSRLWSPHGEHRIPLAQLTYLAFMRMFDNDVRSLMYLGVAMLTAAASLLVVALRRARGRTLWTDALVPLAVLSPGQYQNLLWAFQVCMVQWALLFGVVTAAAISLRRGASTSVLVTFALAVPLLPLCGGPGFLVSLPLVVWLFSVGCYTRFRGSTTGRRSGTLLMVLSGLAGLVLVLYLRGLPESAVMSRVTWSSAVRGTREFLSTAFLPGAAFPTHPGWTGWLESWEFWANLAAGLLIATLLGLVWAWFRHADDRLAISALAAVFSAFGVLALGLGVGRGGYGPSAATASRYMTLATPLLVVAYATFSLHGPPVLRKLVPAALLLTVAVLMTAPNSLFPGLAGTLDRACADGAGRILDYRAFEDDVARGATVEELWARHGFWLMGHTDGVDRVLESMHRHRIGPFRRHPRPLAHESVGPPRELEVPLVFLETESKRGDGEKNRGLYEDRFLMVDLGPPRRVLRVRLAFRVRNVQDGQVCMQIWWFSNRASDGPIQFDDHRTGRKFLAPRSTEYVETFQVYDTIDRLRIHPDMQPCDFTLTGVTLVLPPQGR